MRNLRVMRFFEMPRGSESRTVLPEILDELPVDDPEAIRSRRDLRLINFAMGNYRWVSQKMAGLRSEEPGLKWTEIGAGDGNLWRHLSAHARETATVTGIDLAPRPTGWPAHWNWLQGDLFDHLDSAPEGGLVACLFIHHFEKDALRQIGGKLGRFRRLLFSEPARYPIHHWQGLATRPFVNRVTRHDLHVSINAGFRLGELEAALGLSRDEWEIHEHRSWMGALRLEARRLD